MMNLATIVVTGVYANARRYATIPAGIVGATVTFEFTDPIWEGLTKTAVFQGSATRDVVLKGNTVTVPQEVVNRAGPMLKVGIYGVDAEKNLVVPTLWAAIGGIRDAADPSGDPGTDPELPIWAQLAAEVEKLKLHGGATDEQIQKAVSDYLQKNPIEKLTEEELVAAIKAYFEKNPIDVGSDVCVVYVDNNPTMADVILTSKTSDEIFDAWLNMVPIYGQYNLDGISLALRPNTFRRDKCVFHYDFPTSLDATGIITIEGDTVTDKLIIEKAKFFVTSQIINGNVVYSANATSDEIFKAYEQNAQMSCHLNMYGVNVVLNLVACNENLAVFSNSTPAVQDIPGIGIIIVISGENVSYYEWEVVTGEDLPSDEDIKTMIKEAVDEALKDRPGSGGNVELDTTLTEEGKAADAKATGDALTKVSDEIDSIANLEATIGDSTVKVTGWTKGRIESGEHKDVSWMAYSEMMPITSVTFHFDSTMYKFMYITYDADGNKKYSPTSWITESPVVAETPYAYMRAQVCKLETVKFTDEEFADLPNKVSYTAAGNGEVPTEAPIVKAVIDLKAANTTRYVDGVTGSDDNPGTADAPFATIQKGVDSGTRLLYVAPGTYAEYVRISDRDELTILPTTYPETYDITAPETPMIHITGTEDNRIGRAMYITNCGKISITGVWGDYTKWDVFLASNVKDLTMTGCYASNNATISAFKADNTNAIFRRCKAWNSATDGFGFTNHGDVRLYDCIAHDCADDGVSHHNSCTGMIVGGEFYNCGKGGVASPTYGSYVDVMGVYSHDNVYGLYAMNDMDRRESVSRICGCVFINNATADLRIGQNCKVTGWNNIYNTKSLMDAATYVEIPAASGES